MNRAFRRLVAWMLLWALPLQGFAAPTMVFCGPSHDRMMQALLHEPSVDASSQAEAHSHADAAHHEHGEDASLQHGQFNCSACAACCGAPALPAGFSVPHATGLMHPLRTALEAPVPSQRFDGLERPPRAQHA